MTVIPDGIEPVVAFRSWSFDGTRLRSAHGNDPWEPGEPFEATCPSAFWEWVAVEGGMTLEEIRSAAQPYQYGPGQVWAVTAATSASVYHHQPQPRHGPSHLPNVTLPEGWGYESRVHKHQSPDEGCSCGVYGAATKSTMPQNVVCGKVNLWGKVIMGSAAHRAQFGYPLELEASDDDTASALEVYGVPVGVVPSPSPLTDFYGLQQYPTNVLWNNSSTSVDQTQFTTLMNQLNAQQLYGLSVTKAEWLEDELMPRSTTVDPAGIAPLNEWWGSVKP